MSPRQEWHALIKESLPAYISWEQYERNLARLEANRARADARGAPRSGSALLSGLLTCGKCGHSMTVRYNTENNRRPRHGYHCTRRAVDYGGEACQGMAGAPLDEFVSRWALRALEPAALELSLEAAEHLEREREELDSLWRGRLERANYEAERAGRHYRLLEPENRLVARQLALEWEEKLAAHRGLKEDYERFKHEEHEKVLSAKQREAIERLAKDIPALWEAASTTNEERKEIVRQLIDRVEVEAEGASERVRVEILWVGGTKTEGVVIRPVAKLEQLSYYEKLCERVGVLAGEGLAAREIAEQLNSEGYRPPKRRERFGGQGVADLMARLGLSRRRSRSKERDEMLGEEEWWLVDLASKIEMPEVTLYNWVRRGRVRARQREEDRRWVVWADESEVERLRREHRLPKGYHNHRLWVEEASASAAQGEESSR